MELTELDDECLEGILNFPRGVIRHESQHVFQLIRGVSAKREGGIVRDRTSNFLSSREPECLTMSSIAD